MKHKPKSAIILLSVILLSAINIASLSQAELNTVNEATDVNLLVNGDFDQAGFYWRPPNHQVAGTWYQWWGDYTNIPEYKDGGHPFHNECYPNTPGTLCHDSSTNTYNSSQALIRYGYGSFLAGIYKPVDNVVPCTLYTFEIWNRNDASGSIYHPTLGIDPTGWIITRPSGNDLWNCPPDGHSECPDPYVNPQTGFPATMIWSPEMTQPAKVWAKGSLTAEAINTTISVWVYTAPDEDQVSKSTYWDYGSVTQMPFPNNRLPDPPSWTPTGFIQNINNYVAGNSLVIEWDTLAPASTQISYTVTPAVVTSTLELSHTTYLPVLRSTPRFYYSALDTTPVVKHTVILDQLLGGDTVTFVPMSRRVNGNVCVTEAGLPHQVTFNIP